MKPSFYPEKVKESISILNQNDVEGYEKYMKANEKKMQYTLPVLQRPYSGPGDLLNKDILKLLTVLNPQRSLWDELGKYFEDDRIKVGFTFQSKYLGMSPFNCPSMFSILPYTEYKWGIYHIIGGLNRLAEAMAEVITEYDGKIKLNSEVTEIKIDKGKAVGLEVEGENFHEFDEIIMNADFAWGMKNLIPGEKRKKYSDQNLDQKNIHVQLSCYIWE